MASIIAILGLSIGLIIGVVYAFIYVFIIYPIQDPASRKAWAEACPTFYELYKKVYTARLNARRFLRSSFKKQGI